MLEEHGFKKSTINNALENPSQANFENLRNHEVELIFKQPRPSNSNLPENHLPFTR